MAQFDTLLFDLIGVLVEDSDQITGIVLEASGLTERELWDFWMASPTVRIFS